MKEIVITSQEQLEQCAKNGDCAIIESGTYEVEVTAGSPKFIVKGGYLYVKARGSSQPTMVARESSQPTMVARDWSGVALFRGGFFDSGGRAGVFYLDDVWPDRCYDRVGVRCTKPQ